MVSAQAMLSNAKDIINSNGEIVRIRYYTRNFGAGSYYDDDISFTQSGIDIWTSGLMFPVGNPTRGSAEAMLLEQGKLLADDSVIFFPGDLSLSGAALKIGTGSPVDTEYQSIFPGVDQHGINGTNVYKKIFVRILTNGSLTGE